MQIQLANKLLWKKLFEGAALLSLAAGYKNRSLLSHPPLIDASPGLKLSFRLAAVLLCSCCIWTEARAERFSINNAISQAVLTNPSIGEASANRRATETELRQTQSTLLPQVRLEARVGPERFTQDITPPPLGNGQWLNGKSGSVVVRQILFDGLASIHDIWRQAARVNAASFRVRERSELTALDAAEAYIDVVRFLRLVALADQKLIVPARGGLKRRVSSMRARRLAKAARSQKPRLKYLRTCAARRRNVDDYTEPAIVCAGVLKSCACATTPKSASVSVLPRPKAPDISCAISASGDMLPGRELMETSRKVSAAGRITGAAERIDRR